MSGTRFTIKTVRTLALYAEIETGGRVALASVIKAGDGRTYYCEAMHHRSWTAAREAAAFFLGAVYEQRHRWPDNIRDAFQALEPCGARKGPLTQAFHTGKALAR